MKRLNEKQIMSYAAVVVLILLQLAALAQGPPPGGPGSTGAPIDGGAIALVIGIAAYGYKRMREKKNK